MKDKKRTGKIKENGKGKVDTPISELGEKDTIMHYNAVLIEDLKSQMKFVMECVAAIVVRLDSMEAHMNARFDALEARMDRLEVAVLELRQELKAQGEELKSHKQEHKYMQ